MSLDVTMGSVQICATLYPSLFQDTEPSQALIMSTMVSTIVSKQNPSIAISTLKQNTRIQPTWNGFRGFSSSTIEKRELENIAAGNCDFIDNNCLS